MRILIVDNSPAVLEVLYDILKKPGVKIDTAGNCSEAFELLSKNSYDWATLDLSLPDGNGVDILKEIRIRHLNACVAIISFNAYEPGLCKRLLSLGADAVFPKPFEPRELIECIYGPGSVSK